MGRQFSYDASRSSPTYNPIRDEYAVVQRVTNKLGVPDAELLHTGAAAKRFAKQIPLETLQINDRFFTTY